MAKRKVRADRVIILVLSFLLVFGALGFGVYKALGYFLNKKDTKNNNDTITDIANQTKQGIRISLNDYSIYYDDNDNLGFDFIIANVNFSSNDAIEFDLKDLQTSEKKTLNDVDKYLNVLETSGYDLSKLQINTKGVSTSEKNINVNLFIPFETDSSNLSIYNLSDTSNMINIDLSKEAIAATSLKLSEGNDVIEVGETSVYISKAYISSFMLHNEEPIEIGSTQKYYTFEIKVKETSEKVKITDAVFILDGDDEKIHCEDEDTRSIDTENILNESLNSNSKGGLFFVVNCQSDSIQQGTLLIKFSNSNNWVKLSTNTNE